MNVDIFVNGKLEKWIRQIEEWKDVFEARAIENDRDATFPFQNFNDLKNHGFFQLTVPKKYGGEEVSLYEFLLIQEYLGEADGATALSLGWHNGIVMKIREDQSWNENAYESICLEIVKQGVLMNSCATEPASGSPARGGKPQTVATKVGSDYIINGHKTFTSLAPILDYFIVTATIEDSGEVGEFLIPREKEGLSIKPTWDTLSMRATRSDDLLLENVRVSSEALVSIRKNSKEKKPQGWLLHIPACYLGIAKAARNVAVDFAKEYTPGSLRHPISEIPEVRRKVALMDIEIKKARHMMYHVAKLWDEKPELRSQLGDELASVKHVVTNSAVEIVDIAMRLVGGQSLHRSFPLERLYRDVRAGLHNPPADDLTYMMIGNRAFEENN